jgi:ribosomal protein S18 acetylase RimI-like enzyme
MHDIKELIALCRAEAPYDFLGGRDIDLVYNKITSLGDILQYRSEGKLLGFVSFYTNDLSRGFSFVNMLCVAPEGRGLGIGRLLMDWCGEAASSKGFNELRLEVHTDNHVARGLWTRMGFEDVSDATSASKYMRKPLDENRKASSPE